MIPLLLLSTLLYPCGSPRVPVENKNSVPIREIQLKCPTTLQVKESLIRNQTSIPTENNNYSWRIEFPEETNRTQTVSFHHLETDYPNYNNPTGLTCYYKVSGRISYLPVSIIPNISSSEKLIKKAVSGATKIDYTRHVFDTFFKSYFAKSAEDLTIHLAFVDRILGSNFKEVTNEWESEPPKKIAYTQHN